MYYKLRNKSILLYGGGSTGKILKDKLGEYGIRIYGFVDKRAYILKEIDLIPVYAMEEMKFFAEKTDYVIIVTTRNVFEHSDIAAAFFDMGFYNLIFKPYSVLKGCSDTLFNTISEVHDSFLVRFQPYEDEIPECNHKDCFAFRDRAIICEENDVVKAFVPAELLYSNTISGSIWGECSFLMTYCAVTLYQAFGQGCPGVYEAAVHDYVERFAKPGALQHGVNVDGEWEEILINSRLGSYHEMEKLFSIDRNFFIEHTTTVQYEENARMRLTASGKNRVSFQIGKNIRYIPVAMSKSDYKKYINQDAMETLITYIEKKQPVLLAPIPHPYFYEYRYVAADYVQLWVSRIGRILSDLIYSEEKEFIFEHLTVLDALDDYGTTARILRMAGCRVERMWDKESELEEGINNLLHLPPFEKYSHKEAYDILLMTDRLHNEEAESVIKATGKMCFLCKWNEDDTYEKLLRKYGFGHMSDLFITCWDNRIVRGSVFGKEKIEYVIRR